MERLAARGYGFVASDEAQRVLEIQGYSRESTNETENVRASRARAAAFRDALVSAGMTGLRREMMRIRGYGSTATCFS